MIICAVIFVGVFGAMFYSILNHRKSKGAKSANFHESTVVEITWTVVPFLIVIAMAAPATKVIVAQKDTTNPDLVIKAALATNGSGAMTTLPEKARASASSPRWIRRSGNCPAPARPQGDDYLLKVDNPLVVPVNKKVRMIITANDVIHSWFVPAFGVKQDAIPGFVRDTWFRAEKTGDFYGQCAELCGKGTPTCRSM